MQFWKAKSIIPSSFYLGESSLDRNRVLPYKVQWEKLKSFPHILAQNIGRKNNVKTPNIFSWQNYSVSLTLQIISQTKLCFFSKYNTVSEKVLCLWCITAIETVRVTSILVIPPINPSWKTSNLGKLYVMIGKKRRDKIQDMVVCICTSFSLLFFNCCFSQSHYREYLYVGNQISIFLLLKVIKSPARQSQIQNITE